MFTIFHNFLFYSMSALVVVGPRLDGVEKSENQGADAERLMTEQNVADILATSVRRVRGLRETRGDLLRLSGQVAPVPALGH